jgi:hypothetical protein
MSAGPKVRARPIPGVIPVSGSPSSRPGSVPDPDEPGSGSRGADRVTPNHGWVPTPVGVDFRQQDVATAGENPVLLAVSSMRGPGGHDEP